jgi:hypothetical protein
MMTTGIKVRKPLERDKLWEERVKDHLVQPFSYHLFLLSITFLSKPERTLRLFLIIYINSLLKLEGLASYS